MNYLTLLVGAYLALINSSLRDHDIKYDPEEWESYKKEHERSYKSGAIEMMRRSIFAYNKHIVDSFNVEESEKAGFELGLNHLADTSSIEIKLRNGFKIHQEDYRAALKNSLEGEEFLDAILGAKDFTDLDIPDEIDWRKVEGRVSRVKNQGNCGSCWAFASTGALEGQEKSRLTRSSLSNNTLNDDSSNDNSLGNFDGNIIELSEQNLVDCVTADAGCNGGLMKDAFEFIKVEGGIDDEKSYPYEARTRKCRFKKDKVAFTDSGAAILPEGDEDALKQAVAKFGPVAVAIDASSIWFQLYRKGVYYNKHCKNKPDELDHAVLVVGYGRDPKKGDYWIVKNSWGPKYGEKGYIRMARNRNNNCGIATVATLPIF